MGLYIGRLSSKNGLGTVNGQLFSHVNKFASAVVTLSRIAFGIFVGQLRALRHEDGGGGVVLAGNQLDMVLLALIFSQDGAPQFWVGVFNEVIFLKHDGA